MIYKKYILIGGGVIFIILLLTFYFFIRPRPNIVKISVSPQEVFLFEESTVTITVENLGFLKGDFIGLFKVNGNEKESKNITLNARENKEISFVFTADERCGDFYIEVEIEGENKAEVLRVVEFVEVKNFKESLVAIGPPAFPYEDQLMREPRANYLRIEADFIVHKLGEYLIKANLYNSDNLGKIDNRLKVDEEVSRMEMAASLDVPFVGRELAPGVYRLKLIKHFDALEPFGSYDDHGYSFVQQMVADKDLYSVVEVIEQKTSDPNNILPVGIFIHKTKKFSLDELIYTWTK